MNHRLNHLAAAFLLSAVTLCAVEPTPSKPTETQPYELKKRSAFENVSQNARAPFWPIGWVKRVASSGSQAQAPAAPKVHLDEKSFKPGLGEYRRKPG